MPDNPRTRKLRISPAPFKPTLLSIPPSPFSPRTPITPLRLPQPPVITYPLCTLPAPVPPLAWVWQCHQCHRRYNLGVTRRCLDDGHIFCSGITTVKSWRAPIQRRKAKRHRACTSEFDYQGWKDWGRWQRAEIRIDTEKKNCWMQCDYPSQCRWGRRFGVHTPIVEHFQIEAEPVHCTQQEERVGVEGAEEVAVSSGYQSLANTKRRSVSSSFSSPLVHEVDSSENATISEESTSVSTPSATSISDVFDKIKKHQLSRDNQSKEGSFYNGISGLEEQVSLSDADATSEGWAPLERTESRKHLT